MQDFLKIVYLSFGSLIVLFILTKIMGNKEMSQLNMFDYIVSITIGSIAAEMATSLENNFMEPLVAMAVYALVTLIISLINSKSLKLRRILSGESIILLNNGKLYRKNFKKARLDINEFLIQCRSNGYFNISDIQTAIFEPNGKISFLPKSIKRPVTPEDLNIDPNQERTITNVILDGYILIDNLKAIGLEKNWLEKELKKQGIQSYKNVFLATCDQFKNLSVYVKIDRKNTHDGFE